IAAAGLVVAAAGLRDGARELARRLRELARNLDRTVGRRRQAALHLRKLAADERLRTRPRVLRAFLRDRALALRAGLVVGASCRNAVRVGRIGTALALALVAEAVAVLVDADALARAGRHGSERELLARRRREREERGFRDRLIAVAVDLERRTPRVEIAA